jgi:hypothetical protein
MFVTSILCIGCMALCVAQATALPEQGDKPVVKVHVPDDSSPAVKDILSIVQHFRYAPISELLRSRERYDAVARLVGHLRDPEAREEAWDVLTIIQPDTPGSPKEYEKWMKWLVELKSPVETRPYPEALQDIDILRSRMEQRKRESFDELTRKDIKESTQYYRDVNGLIEYLRHPSERVRLYAWRVLISTQPSCPGGPNTPDIWENWLKRVEAGELEQQTPKTK